jgi:hypothetical protein
MRYPKIGILLCLALCSPWASASESAEIQELKTLLQELKADYEARILSLESRLDRAERQSTDAYELAEETAISASSGQTAANTFNPSIGSVLVGRYSNLDNNWETIPGFAGGGELGPGTSGFSLGESEINFKASVDGLFYGNLTLALEDEDGDTEIGVEEAWIPTLALPYGFTGRAGRYFSGIGYLNSFHRHADDFSDRPLPYQAFFGGQYIEDGAEIRWLAPTALFLELGGSANWSDRYPATGGGSSADAWDVFAHLGGDLGDSHSWQVGMSYLSFDNEQRTGGEEEPATFSGDSDIIGLDFVWKWAPRGNSAVRNFKLQGEYFYREEDGTFADLDYDGDQSGWYLQSVWQFMPRWRAGYRHDQMDTDNGDAFTGTALEDPDHTPRRDSVMVDWSASEFSRIRLQYSYDQVESDSDHQITLQYIMSLGAHGAHRF